MNWQPIETAPKDGTPFIAWDGDMFVAYYRPGCKILIDQQRDDWSGYRPKFWHPLPPPPVVKESLTPAMDNDLDEPLGKGCSLDNPDCEACQ